MHPTQPAGGPPRERLGLRPAALEGLPAGHAAARIAAKTAEPTPARAAACC